MQGQQHFVVMSLELQYECLSIADHNPDLQTVLVLASDISQISACQHLVHFCIGTNYQSEVTS